MNRAAGVLAAAIVMLAQHSARAELRTVEPPVQAVLLGQGWNSTTRMPSPARCISAMAETSSAMRIEVSLGQITSLEHLARQAEISHSQQISFAAGSATATRRTTYLLNRRVRTSTATTFVWGKARRIRSVVPGGGSDPSIGFGQIQLNGEALALLRHDLEAFRAVCGTGFIYAIAEGADLYGSLEVLAHTRLQSENATQVLDGKILGSGAGLNLTDTLTDLMKLERSYLSFQRFGGKGTAVLPTDLPSLLSALGNLEVDAREGALPFSLHVNDYGPESVSNWPSGLQNQVNLNSLGALLSVFWRYRHVEDLINEVLDDPNPFALEYGWSRTAAVAALAEARSTRLNLTRQIQLCHEQPAAMEKCPLPSSINPLPISLVRTLPLLRQQTPAMIEIERLLGRSIKLLEDVSTIRKAVGDRNPALREDFVAALFSREFRESWASALPQWSNAIDAVGAEFLAAYDDVRGRRLVREWCDLLETDGCSSPLKPVEWTVRRPYYVTNFCTAQDAAIYRPSGPQPYFWLEFGVNALSGQCRGPCSFEIDGGNFPPGTSWQTCTGYTLSFQTDSNLVLYNPGGMAIWDTKTYQTGANVMSMQADGNLVLYRSGQHVWNTQTHGNPGAYLFVASDGNVAVYARQPSSNRLWETGTGGR